MSDFSIAVSKTLAHEGGYADDPHDPGGETNFGISKRSYPDVDIRNLTGDQAIAIYRRDFWHDLYDQIADQRLANALFDFGVNAGVEEAVKVLQRAVQKIISGPVIADGIFGPQTLQAVNSVAEPDELLRRFTALRLNVYRQLSEADRYFTGWAERATDW